MSQPEQARPGKRMRIRQRRADDELWTLVPDRAAPTPANAQPKAKAVVPDSGSPMWSNAGGIFQPDAQNPVPVSLPDALLPQQPPNPILGQPLLNLPTFAGISALVFDPSSDQPTLARASPTASTSATVTPATRRPATMSAFVTSPSASTTTSVSSSSVTSPSPTIVTQTRSSTATSSSVLLTTAIITASRSTSASIPSSATASAASASASPTSFLATIASSPVSITITVLVCVGILALVIAFLFFFIRRCQRRRKKRRLGDILASEFGSPRHDPSSMSEWATPGPGWTDKYYGEQIGGRMVGGASLSGSAGRPAEARDEEEYWQSGLGMGMEGGYGVARSLSQQRRTNEWANRHAEQDLARRASWEEIPYAGGEHVLEHTHVLDYAGGHGFVAPAPPPQAIVRDRSELDLPQGQLAPPQALHPTRPRPLQATSYSSYASESTYPVDEIGDIEAEQKELAETMSALDLGPGQRLDTTSPPAQTTWRDSLDWVMGSAADLIGSKLLARNGSADTLVASPPKKVGEDRFTQRPPSIRIPRPAADPRTISDQFTPLSPSYGDRFLNPTRSEPRPPTLSRQSSMISLTSSADFATTNQHGTFAQGARSRLFDAALAKNAQLEDEMEVLNDIAATMMSRQTTEVTHASELPSNASSPYARFEPATLSAGKFVSSPVDMSPSSSVSTSSSFTYRPSPPQPTNELEVPLSSDMRKGWSASSIDSKASFDAFGRGNLTPRQYHERLRMSRQRTMSKRRTTRKAAAMGPGPSMTSISTFDDSQDEYFEWQHPSNGRHDAVRELMVERRRRSDEFEESLL
ncbi:uncharacterized protein JCM15063_003089 [Sporobolomyces koalae]|uniref:uncharacterized protein n=1 Tax=Sporobolomyces koalae TaxID=500713 RepID=UPI0031799277